MKPVITSFRHLGALSAIGAAALLAACGGGGSSPAPVITVSGVAAIGSTINGGAVSVTCAKGVGTATTSGTGSYTVTIENGEGPCVVSVTQNGVTLTGLAAGTTGTLAANVTPLTTAFVQYLGTLSGSSGTSATALLADAEAVALLKNPAAVEARATADFIPFIETKLGIDITNNSFLTATINPTSDTNGADADLEKFKTALGISSTTTTAFALPTTLVTDITTKATTDAATKPIVISTTGAGS